MENLSPIVLFVYNRVHYLKETVESLKSNYLADRSILYIYSDGPKNPEDEKKILEVRKFLRSIDGFKEIYIIERERNWGLAENIISGVTEIVNMHGKVIVLEDDLVTSQYFLKYMNKALNFYEDVPRVMCASGYNYPINTEGLPDCFFIQDGQTWGWATWKRAWDLYERDVEKVLKLFTKEMIKKFDFNNSGHYWYQVELNKKGKLNTWGIFWHTTIFLNDGLTLFPRESLIQHIGKGGTHFGNSSVYDVKLSTKSEWNFPTEIEESSLGRERFEEFLHSIKPNILRRLLNRIRKVLHR